MDEEVEKIHKHATKIIQDQFLKKNAEVLAWSERS